MRGGHRPPWDPRWRRCCWPGPSREGDRPQLRGCGPCSVPAETHGLMSVPGSTGTRGQHLQTGPEPPPRPCPEPRGTRTPRTAPKTRVRPPAPRGASPGGRPRLLALACPPREAACPPASGPLCTRPSPSSEAAGNTGPGGDTEEPLTPWSQRPPSDPVIAVRGRGLRPRRAHRGLVSARH